MRRHVIAACSAVFVILFAQPAVAADELQPIGKWTVDFGESRCTAYRSYGSQDEPIHLFLRPSPIGDVLQVQIVEKGHERPGIQEKAKLTLGAGEPLRLLQLRYGFDGMRVRQVNLSKEQYGQLAQSTTLEWAAQSSQYRLALGAMAKLIKTIEECRVNLAEYWNGTPTKRPLLQQQPSLLTPVRQLFSTDDYPWDAAMSEQSGETYVVALVDEKGALANCNIIETSGIAVLDAQTCIILRERGKFAPAIGADGKPAKGVFTQRIRWEMPLSAGRSR